MLLRNKRKLLSFVLTIVLFSGIYIIAKDIKLNIVSKTIIREPSEQSSTVEQLGKLLSNYGSSNRNEEEEKKADSGKQQDKDWESIMPSMPDVDAKKELGRASWKYFHTLLARFPDEPTEEERNKLENFVKLYAELYPCGECSYHFQKMLIKYPVQTSSRTNAAMWGCHIHNVVNEYLKKEVYDCSTILEDYDCGCGDDDNTKR